jgi:pyruvate,water dikinase
MEEDRLILKLREPKTKKVVREKQALKGTPAQLGKVRGKIKIILDPKANQKMKRNDVLVTKMTSPDFLMAIHRAAAVVTDEGGITCHAAIVSREFGIPCVVGTKIATQVLKDGDLVEVDAEKGIVKKLTKLDNK